jgi:hypothetical protein
MSTSETPADKTPTFEAKAQDAAADTPLERPEVQVGAAFAGGLLVALILKKLGN